MESINAVPATPEYVENQAVTEMLKFADVDQYDDEAINRAEAQMPGFIERRSDKLSKLPVLGKDDFIPTVTNKFVSSDANLASTLQDVIEKQMSESINIKGLIEAPAEVRLFIDDLSNVLPRILRAEGAEKLTEFNSERVIFVDTENSNSFIASLLKKNKGNSKSGGAIMIRGGQFIAIDSEMLKDTTALVHILIHEYIHILGFSSTTINNSGRNKQGEEVVRDLDRRSGIRVLHGDNVYLSALNEVVTEELAKKISSEYYDIFPFSIDSVNENFQNENEGSPADKVMPFNAHSGLMKDRINVLDVSSNNYNNFKLKYDTFLSEIALKENIPVEDIQKDIIPKLKDAYLNGRMLPLFRSFARYGISVDDLIEFDNKIIKEASVAHKNM